MKIISGGQTGVDRAALDVAIERNLPWGGWCPKGGWAEDFPDPPGLLAKYPNLHETPDPHPLQRTEWNVRDTDATWKPLLVINATTPDVLDQAAAWVREQRKRFGSNMTLGIGGPRESEASGVYMLAKGLIATLLDRVT
jgi:hypothetical protein